MRVKIGVEIYDSNEVPIMLVLDDIDKKNIHNMAPEATKYCSYPILYNPIFIRNWMINDRKTFREGDNT